MSQKNNPWDEDDPDTRSLISRLIEDVIAFVICCYLTRLGVCWLLSIKIPLLVIAVTVGVAIISYRVYRWRKHHDDY